MDNVNGIILWRGRSALDGAPIVCVATGITRASRNRKTGRLVQTWILREDVSPVEAQNSGRDAAICGQCVHRPWLGGDCYVQVGQAPLAVWRALQAGAYPSEGDAAWPELHARMRARGVRAGSYGDPALVPAYVWARANVATGYTHLWRHAWARGHQQWLMASCDGPGDLADARRDGWRCFMVAADAPDAGTIQCPAVTRGLECDACRLCGGASRAGAKDIWISPHGARAESEVRGLLRIMQ